MKWSGVSVDLRVVSVVDAVVGEQLVLYFDDHILVVNVELVGSPSNTRVAHFTFIGFDSKSWDLRVRVDSL